MTDDRISKKVPRTEKVMLTCRNHQDLRWMTKNIGFVGARSIFYVGTGSWASADTVKECDCPGSDLMLLPEYEDMPVVPV